MTEIDANFSLTALNVNDLHPPIKAHSLEDWMLKRPNHKDTHFTGKNKEKFTVKGWTKGWPLYFKPVILVTGEAEIERIVAQGHPRVKKFMTYYLNP
jgi:hypothetical protein